MVVRSPEERKKRLGGNALKPSNVRLWTVIGAIVGTLIMPSTWLFLFGIVAGTAIRDFTSGDSTGLETDPFEGLLDEPGTTATTLPVETGSNATGNAFVFVMIVAVVATVIGAVYFAWIGKRLAEARNARLETSTGVAG
jgi:hypothetical protein